MDRLQTKCLAASAGFHLLLVVICLAGSAFRSRTAHSSANNPDTGIIDLVTLPAETTQPTLSSTPARPPVPQRNETQPVKNQNGELPLNRTPPRPTPSPGHADGTKKSTPPRDPRAKEFGRAIQELARKLPTAGKGIALELSSDKTSQDDAYSRIVRFFYTQSWQPADDGTAKSGARVSVTIDNDGRVSSARIIEPSGDAALDDSVRRTLERVQFVEPFEAGAKDSSRTYVLNFTLHVSVEEQ